MATVRFNVFVPNVLYNDGWKLLYYMKHSQILVVKSILLLLMQGVMAEVHSDNNVVTEDSTGKFIRVSKVNPDYLEFENGGLYIPVGVNICWPRFVSSEDSIMQKMEDYMQKLGSNGGNFTRIWLSAPAFEVEHQRAGEYDEIIARRIDRLVAMAERNGVKIKFCLENFRNLTNMPPIFPGSVPFDKPVYDTSNGGPLTTMDDFFRTQEGEKLYLERVDFLSKRYGNNPAIFGWELWNEVNSVRVADKQLVANWTEKMLSEVKKRMPYQLVMQSLGSFDTAPATELYRSYSLMEGNQLAQVHRYLDPGAKLDVSKGAMDKLAYDAVETLRKFNPSKPVLLSEVGAVEANHAGPSRLYEKDSVGMMFHDYLFAAFFAGAAGPGQSWHWDYYIDKHNLWYHLNRFNNAVKGIDPRMENFEPFVVKQGKVTIYGLKGKLNVLLWIRDHSNIWEVELTGGQKPAVLSGVSIKLPFKLKTNEVRFYDPWADKSIALNNNGTSISLPDFKRSGVVQITIRK